MAIDEQRVDWIESRPGEQLKRQLNESIKTHNQQGFELEHMKEIRTENDSIVRMVLLYEKD